MRLSIEWIPIVEGLFLGEEFKLLFFLAMEKHEKALIR